MEAKKATTSDTQLRLQAPRGKRSTQATCETELRASRQQITTETELGNHQHCNCEREKMASSEHQGEQPLEVFRTIMDRQGGRRPVGHPRTLILPRLQVGRPLGESDHQRVRDLITPAFPKLQGQFNLLWKDSDGDFVVFSPETNLSDCQVSTDSMVRLYIEREGNATGEEKEELPTNVHPNVVCDGCGGKIQGARSQCLECPDFNLCSACADTDMHSDHVMVKGYRPRFFHEILPKMTANMEEFLSKTKGDSGSSNTVSPWRLRRFHRLQQPQSSAKLPESRMEETDPHSSIDEEFRVDSEAEHTRDLNKDEILKRQWLLSCRQIWRQEVMAKQTPGQGQGPMAVMKGMKKPAFRALMRQFWATGTEILRKAEVETELLKKHREEMMDAEVADDNGPTDDDCVDPRTHPMLQWIENCWGEWQEQFAAYPDTVQEEVPEAAGNEPRGPIQKWRHVMKTAWQLMLDAMEVTEGDLQGANIDDVMQNFGTRHGRRYPFKGPPGPWAIHVGVSPGRSAMGPGGRKRKRRLAARLMKSSGLGLGSPSLHAMRHPWFWLTDQTELTSCKRHRGCPRRSVHQDPEDTDTGTDTETDCHDVTEDLETLEIAGEKERRPVHGCHVARKMAATRGMARGGFGMTRGGFGMARGGLSMARGGFGMARGGLSMARGGFGMATGGPSMGRGGLSMARGGLSMARGGPSMARGGRGMAGGRGGPPVGIRRRMWLRRMMARGHMKPVRGAGSHVCGSPTCRGPGRGGPEFVGRGGPGRGIPGRGGPGRGGLGFGGPGRGGPGRGGPRRGGPRRGGLGFGGPGRGGPGRGGPGFGGRGGPGRGGPGRGGPRRGGPGRGGLGFGGPGRGGPGRGGPGRGGPGFGGRGGPGRGGLGFGGLGGPPFDHEHPHPMSAPGRDDSRS